MIQQSKHCSSKENNNTTTTNWESSNEYHSNILTPQIFRFHQRFTRFQARFDKNDQIYSNFDKNEQIIQTGIANAKLPELEQAAQKYLLNAICSQGLMSLKTVNLIEWDLPAALLRLAQ